MSKTTKPIQFNQFVDRVKRLIEEDKEKKANWAYGSVPTTKWKHREISPEDREIFISLFDAADSNDSGFVSADIALRIFQEAQLQIRDVYHILNLVEPKQVNRMDKWEFILAMFLIKCRIEGETLPSSLPESLKADPLGVDRFKRGSTALVRGQSIRRMGKNLGSGPSYKVCFLGDEGCGKSSIITRFLFDEFYTTEESTVEDHYHVNYRFDEKDFHLRILDTGGNDYYLENMSDKWFQDADGFVLVYSIDSRFSFETLEAFRNKLMQKFKDDRIPIVIVGSKVDKEDSRQVTEKQVNTYCKLHNFPRVDVSAKNGTNIEDPFKMIINRIEKHKNRLNSVASTPREEEGESEKDDPFVSHVTDKELMKTLENPELSAKFLNYLRNKNSFGARFVEFYLEVKKLEELDNPSDIKKKTAELLKVILVADQFLKIPLGIVEKLRENSADIEMFGHANKFVLREIQKTYFPQYVKYLYDQMFHVGQNEMKEIHPQGSTDDLKTSAQILSEKKEMEKKQKELEDDLDEFKIDEKYRINFQEIEFEKLIGSGNYGEVWKAKWRSSEVAVKRVKNIRMSPEATREFLQETRLMMKLKVHPNVIHLFGLCDDPLAIVTEFMENGSLLGILQKTPNIQMKQKLQWMEDIAAGMLHLSIEKIVHKDLAARNILVGRGMIAKVSDFGLSRLAESPSEDNSLLSIRETGPLDWMAPESLWESKYSTKSDIWSFGVTCVEILTQKEPTLNCYKMTVGNMLKRLVLPMDTPQQLDELIRKCFSEKPSARPNFQQILDELREIQEK